MSEDHLLTPAEVASKFRVDPKTVTRWAAAGKLSSIRTPGGHRRFRASQVEALLEAEGTTATDAAPSAPATAKTTATTQPARRTTSGG